MTEIKRRDIIKLYYDTGETSYALVDEIDDTNIRVREPPDKTVTFNITDGVMEGVTSIELVYSSPVTGIAVARNFVEGQSIVMVYKSAPEEEKVGVITRLEEDMIDVNIDGEMIYIDFGYVGVPEEFQSITLHGGFIFEMEDDYYIPESQHRYTLERQLTDLMDKLLAVPKQTSRTIRNANRVVQRFRELRQLFSNDQLEPQRNLFELNPFLVKWILPVLDSLGRGRIRRTLFKTDEDSLESFRQMSKTQLGQNSSTGRSFRSIYTKLLNEIAPFISDLNGTKIHSTIEVLLPKAILLKSISPKLPFKEIQGKFLSQVLVKPYADPYNLIHTTPEIADFVSYYVLPVDYTRAFVPGNTLLTRTQYAKLAIYTHRVPTGESLPLSECIPSQERLVDTPYPFYSIQGCVQQLSPYLIHQNNVTFLYEHILPKLKECIQTYQTKLKLPAYVPNPLLEYEGQSASEHQVELLHTDNGSLYAITQCKQMNLDYTSKLDKHIEKRLEPAQIAPPVVKVYATIKQLTSDNGKHTFYDPEFDKTDYAAYKGMDLEELIEHLVRVEYMTPSDAYLYAPYLFKKQRLVLNGDYAQLATPNGMVYYKRINQTWKLDDTCSGPYPCTSDEPECTIEETSCVDVSFRLKQNLIHSILVDYQLEMYKSKAVFEKFIQERESTLTYLLHAKKHLREQSALKYNKRMNAMGKSIVIIQQSPKAPLLNLILEKPFEERYTELIYFIRDYTRVAHSTEDVHWLYCISTGLKLLPRVFQSLLQGYEEQRYKEVLVRLLSEGTLVKEDGAIVTTHGGFMVGTIDFEHTFDEMVHSTEFEEDPIYTLKREENPLTPFLVELLNTTSISIGVNVTSYYNFMIHKILSSPSNRLIQAVALVLRFAEIEYSISIEDKIAHLLKKKQAYQTIFTKFKQPMEELSAEVILKEIKKVSNYYEVKQLVQRKPNATVRLQTTSSTLWETFLPPSKIHVTSARTEYNMIMTILQMIQTHARKRPLREGTYRVNTILQPIVPADAIPLMRRFDFITLSYTTSKLFIPEKLPLPYDKDITQIILPALEHGDVSVVKEVKPYDVLIPQILNELISFGFTPSLNTQEVPIVYLQSFIQNIGRLYPSFLLNKPDYYEWNAYPIRFEKILLPRHLQQLEEMGRHSIFGKLEKCSTQHIGLQGILEDKTIDEMIQQFSLTRTDLSREQCVYYIYSIFQKYITRCPIDHHRVLFGILDIYCESFSRDVKKVFVTMEAIDSYILKEKTNEANDRQLQRDQMTSDDKFLFDFRQSMNLSKEAQLGRSRTYNAEQHELESALFGNDFGIAEDNDPGGDGNDGDEND
jgi:hypothetical protein